MRIGLKTFLSGISTYPLSSHVLLQAHCSFPSSFFLAVAFCPWTQFRSSGRCSRRRMNGVAWSRQAYNQKLKGPWKLCHSLKLIVSTWKCVLVHFVRITTYFSLVTRDLSNCMFHLSSSTQRHSHTTEWSFLIKTRLTTMAK